jgi:hypothetical protein
MHASLVRRQHPVMSFGMDVALHACGIRGHATFAPDEPELQARLRVETPAGDAWRCLRCETFVVGEPVGHGPAETAPHVRRGRNLRDVVILRALAVERVVRAVIFALLAVGVLAVRGTQRRRRGLPCRTQRRDLLAVEQAAASVALGTLASAHAHETPICPAVTVRVNPPHFPALN